MENKTIIHYNIMVKNQVAQLKKGWKWAKKTLGITGVKLLHKNDIYENRYIIDNYIKLGFYIYGFIK